MEVVPAIIPRSEEHLRASIAKLEGAVASFQIDFVDGVFAGEPSWPFADPKAPDIFPILAELASAHALECDLMIKDPETRFAAFDRAGASRIALHFGSSAALDRILEAQRNASVGIAILNDTPLEMLAPYAEKIDFIQCMGIAEIGRQGAAFDERVLQQIREAKERFPNLPVSVDGHVSMFTLPLLKDAGATRFVAGSAIYGAEDPVQAFKELQALAEA